jgi:hypothetical protein
LNVNVSTDRRRAVSGGSFFSINDDRIGSGGGWNLGVFLNFQPSDNIAFSLEPRFSAFHSPDQYVTSTASVPYGPTYDRRYIFAELEQRSFEMGARVDGIFSPNLSLQVFAQPLLSSGDYLTYKQLAAAETFDFVDLGPSDPSGTQSVDFDGDATVDFTFSDRDFNVRSLIGNAVLRWEYRPGSTAFLVWQRTQSQGASFGDFDLGRDFGDLFGAPAHDRFIVKLTYWLGL